MGRGSLKQTSGPMQAGKDPGRRGGGGGRSAPCGVGFGPSQPQRGASRTAARSADAVHGTRSCRSLTSTDGFIHSLFL